jgi:hypothetical protein
MPIHEVNQTEQDMPALGSPHGAPGAFEGAAGSSDRPVDIGLVALGNRGDDLFTRRILRLESAAGNRIHLPTIYQQLAVREAERGRNSFGSLNICNRHHISSNRYVVDCEENPQ